MPGRAGDFDRAAQLLIAYAGRLQQPDGIFNHATDGPAAWGRGNGFAAFGLMEVLTAMPTDHPSRSALLAIFQKQMKGLAAWQAPDGMWREIIDRPGAYREETATAMILTAMARGVRLGWIDRSYAPSVDRAWRALAAHITRGRRPGRRLHRHGRRPDAALLLRSPRDRRPRRSRRRDGAGRGDGAVVTIRKTAENAKTAEKNLVGRVLGPAARLKPSRYELKPSRYSKFFAFVSARSAFSAVFSSVRRRVLCGFFLRDDVVDHVARRRRSGGSRGRCSDTSAWCDRCPSRCRMVACRSCTWTGFSTALKPKSSVAP